jgi:hypothetical protein
MRVLGFLLLLAGWSIVLAAVILLGPGATRAVFLLAGIGVEVIGLVVVFRSHLSLRVGHE